MFMSGNLRKDKRLEINPDYLAQYLKVYNAATDNEVGSIGNLSQYGIMLMTKWSMEIGSVFKFYIKLPEAFGSERMIYLDARCQWCYQDVGGEYYDSGYVLVYADPNYELLMHGLKRYLTRCN